MNSPSRRQEARDRQTDRLDQVFPHTTRSPSPLSPDEKQILDLAKAGHVNVKHINDTTKGKLTGHLLLAVRQNQDQRRKKKQKPNK